MGCLGSPKAHTLSVLAADFDLLQKTMQTGHIDQIAFVAADCQ
jgi:hypothetical protein